MSENNLNTKIFHILIVDDDDDDRDFLHQTIIEVMPSSNIIQANNGQVAVNYLLGPLPTLPDLIFMDLNMPFMSGKEATLLIKNDARLKQVPIIVLTTSSSIGEKQYLLNNGASDFFTKPNSLNDLKKIVQITGTKWLNMPANQTANF